MEAPVELVYIPVNCVTTCCCTFLFMLCLPSRWPRYQFNTLYLATACLDLPFHRHPSHAQ